MVGGFPCQCYSVARSLSSEKGIEGKKGVLFWDIRDVIVAKQSPFVLLENVDRLLKSPASKRGRDFAVMLKTFSELGYDVQWRVINAGQYSMPQKRKRVFIFAYKNSTKFVKKIKLEDVNLNIHNIFEEDFSPEELEIFLSHRDFDKAVSYAQSFLAGMELKEERTDRNKYKSICI